MNVAEPKRLQSGDGSPHSKNKNPLTNSLAAGRRKSLFVRLPKHTKHETRPATGVVMPESMMAVMCASKHCGRGLYLTNG
jgi:hypothetical protein